MIMKYHEKAKEKHVSIIISCGFDSVPADLGVVHNTSQFKDKSRCSSVESYLHV